MAATPFSLCVYCGARTGTEPAYAAAARRVGTLIGERGWRLVYGGGRVGLMGEVANAALAAGATVIGVIPQALMGRELGHGGLAELHVVETMHQRKQMMADRSDAFLALPGGIGTLEELFEAWTWRQLGYHAQPVGLLNVEGYYDPLLEFIARAGQEAFVPPDQLALLQVGGDPAELLSRLALGAAGVRLRDDFRRI